MFLLFVQHIECARVGWIHISGVREEGEERPCGACIVLWFCAVVFIRDIFFFWRVGYFLRCWRSSIGTYLCVCCAVNKWSMTMHDLHPLAHYNEHYNEKNHRKKGSIDLVFSFLCGCR